MKRILILLAITLLLCSTAGAFQGGGGESTKNPKPSPKPKSAPKPKVEPHKRSSPPTAGIGSLPLRSFEFDVVTVNSSGAITNRRKGQSRYYVEQVNGIDLELVEVPGSTFLMGETESEADQVKKQYERLGIRPEVASKSSRQEVPQHTVSVSTFYMGKYEVTQAQWRAVSRLPKINRDLVSDPAYFKGDSLPVEQVSWEDAVEFCARLSRATGRTYRLPTEAEWEYACRGGTTTPFAFGETIIPQIVNYDGNYPYAQAAKGTHRERTTPVGFMGVANGFGLFDMHGNVYEWCLDYWHENYNGAPTDGTSWETADDYDRRVLRGGAQAYFASDARSASRSFTTQDFRNQGYGFRVVAVVRTR